MRALVQRVTEASVTVENPNYYAEIKKGMVVLLGVKQNDTLESLNFVADKCCNLRIFEDANQKMNLSLKDVNGKVLVISQFTLYGDARKGCRPSFTDAAQPQLANELYEQFCNRVRQNLGPEKVKTGVFAAMMLVKIFNDGPVTILVESKEQDN